MKILQISTTDIGGGAEISSWNLFKAYRQRGFRSWLAVGRKLSDDADVFEIPRLKSASWPHPIWVMHGRLAFLEGKIYGIRRIRSLLRKIAGGRRELELRLGIEDFNFPGTWQLLKLTPERPDIIHAHNLHGGYFDLRYLVDLSHRVPVIVNLRDMWLLTGHCAYSVGCGRWKTGCGNCPDLTIYPEIERDATAYNWYRKRRIYNKSRLYVTAVSKWLMDNVQQSILSAVECRMIPNGIDLDVFKPVDKQEARTNLGLPANVKIVILTAQNDFKDYATMVDALEQLSGFRDEELLFYCFGKKGQDRILGHSRIVHPGFLRDPVRMSQFYNAADVFIHAAYDEAFGKTIIEAMACGTPVVATAVDAIPELIEDGVTGYLVPPHDSSAMAQRIHRLLDDPVLTQQIGMNSMSIVHKKYSLTRQVDNFLEWYKEILRPEENLDESSKL